MHIPVLLQETIHSFAYDKPQIFVDATVNRGGHSKEILKLLSPSSTLIAIDLDQEALQEAEKNLKELAEKKGIRLIFVNDNFRNIRTILADLEIVKIDSLLADLGVSSQELDSSERGFSFRYDEPLFMTLKSSIDETDITAKDVVNNWSYELLLSILNAFSDERYAHRIAKAIVESRSIKPITTTHELVEIVRSALPVKYIYGKTHFATKTFQAIRMAVNDELGAITELIESLPIILQTGGIASVITFHSTEDRLVKHEVRKRETELSFVQKKAIAPTEEEIITNPRSRSAQLRSIKRL